ncbi:NAD(P)H-dependent glycerol-3-phosphate dehydrogenase [Spiroplasma endosymbiont of Amphibalanus improvisus]|uniref:NAD(P)H-dependent glycerol-3-phosphate dehydrogenase n=1 Tax=Spiroplasma endosymbiont of Amphibalanus improvisus TaxID=3066327 RepID=UPI00313BE1AF
MAIIAIMGTGAFGTALANVFADSNHTVKMYGIDDLQIKDINKKNINSSFFGNLKLNPTISASNDIATTLEDAEYIIFSVPTQFIKSIAEQINEHLKTPAIFVNSSKGLDPETDELFSKMLEKWIKPSLNKGISAIYGPSIAVEVIEKSPTCLMAASKKIKIAKQVKDLFDTDYFVVRETDDIVGCELGAALKNVIAIASGISEAINKADNTHACIITMGLNEMAELALKYGAKKETFINYAFLADLLLTANSNKSRNFSLGYKIGKSDNAEKVMSKYTKTTEGVTTSKTVYKIMQKLKMELPLITAVYKILYENEKPSLALNNILLKS